MPTAIDRHELQRLLADEQAQLIEVLPEAEFADEHLPGAINIPLKQLDRERRALAMALVVHKAPDLVVLGRPLVR